MSQSVKKRKPASPLPQAYPGLVSGITELLEITRRASAGTINAFMTATYWEVGRRIVEFEQAGEKRAGYGDEVLIRLANVLTKRFGRGFSRFNLGRFRQFYIATPVDQIRATLSGNSETASRKSATDLAPFALSDLAQAFPLLWSHYVLLIGRSRSPEAFAFYRAEALRGGWSVRQLERQMDSQF